MDVVDLKIWGINSFAITVSLLDIDIVLKILLGITALGYTIHKWYLMWKLNQIKIKEKQNDS